MPLTMTETLWGKLESDNVEAVELYELELDAATLYYSSVEVSWGGNTYSRLAIEREPIEEEMAFTVPDVRVVFSNVNNTLRSQFTPSDLVTGKDMTIRTIFGDGAGGYETDSLVLFAGTMERPERISDREWGISVVGKLEGFAVDTPRRQLWTSCPWQYATAPLTEGCGYDSAAGNTTASNTGSSSTTLVVNSATGLIADDFITIGGGAEVSMSSISGTTVTLGTAQSWSAGDVVALSRCNREFSDCQNRAQEHRFGGFLGVTTISRLRVAVPDEAFGIARPK